MNNERGPIPFGQIPETPIFSEKEGQYNITEYCQVNCSPFLNSRRWLLDDKKKCCGVISLIYSEKMDTSAFITNVPNRSRNAYEEKFTHDFFSILD